MIKYVKNVEGYTLIELLIVLAVLGLVSTLLISHSFFHSNRVDADMAAESVLRILRLSRQETLFSGDRISLFYNKNEHLFISTYNSHLFMKEKLPNCIVISNIYNKPIDNIGIIGRDGVMDPNLFYMNCGRIKYLLEADKLLGVIHIHEYP